MYTLQKSPLHQWVSEPEDVGSMYTLHDGPLYHWVSEPEYVESMYTLKKGPLYQWEIESQDTGSDFIMAYSVKTSCLTVFHSNLSEYYSFK